MKPYRHFAFVAVVLAGIAALALTSHPVVKPARAAATVLCAPTIPDAANARRVVNPNNSVGTIGNGVYLLNGQGCTVVSQADVGYFLNQGFSPGAPFGANILYTTGVLTGTTSVQIGTLPASVYVQHIIVNNSTTNAVTGGINFGSTSGASDIQAARKPMPPNHRAPR